LRLSGLEGREIKTKRRLEASAVKKSELPYLRKQHKSLLREGSATEELVRIYSAKLEEARISEQMDREKIANIVILQRAFVSPVPVSVGTPVILLIGAMVAGVLAVVVVLLVDRVTIGSVAVDGSSTPSNG